MRTHIVSESVAMTLLRGRGEDGEVRLRESWRTARDRARERKAGHPFWVPIAADTPQICQFLYFSVERVRADIQN